MRPHLLKTLDSSGKGSSITERHSLSHTNTHSLYLTFSLYLSISLSLSFSLSLFSRHFYFCQSLFYNLTLLLSLSPYDSLSLLLISFFETFTSLRPNPSRTFFFLPQDISVNHSFFTLLSPFNALFTSC